MIKNKVVRNASWIIVCKIVQTILGMIISIFTARYLGPSNFGVISYAASIVSFFVPIMQLGLNNILVQETIQNPEEEGAIYGSALLLNFLCSLACIVGMTTFVLFTAAKEPETIFVCILYSTILIAQALEQIQYWYQAKYLSKYVSIVSLCAYLLVSIYKIFLLMTQKSIYWFAVSNAIDYFLISFALLIIYKKKGGQRLRFSRTHAKRMVCVGKYYILSALMVTLFANTDKIMLKMMIDDAATGYYSVAVTCAGVTSFIFSAIIDSARPAILESRKDSDSAFEKNMSKLYCIVTYLSLAQSLFMTLFSKYLITLLYGAIYAPAIPALRLIVWYTTFAYYGAIRNVWILSEGKQKHLLFINLSGVLANILLNALLIPFWGLLGAAFASLATQIFTNIVTGFFLKPIARNNLLILKGLNPFILFERHATKEK